MEFYKRRDAKELAKAGGGGGGGGMSEAKVKEMMAVGRAKDKEEMEEKAAKDKEQMEEKAAAEQGKQDAMRKEIKEEAEVRQSGFQCLPVPQGLAAGPVAAFLERASVLALAVAGVVRLLLAPAARLRLRLLLGVACRVVWRVLANGRRRRRQRVGRGLLAANQGRCVGARELVCRRLGVVQDGPDALDCDFVG